MGNKKTDIVPPPMFSAMQSQCSVLTNYRILLWKDGLKLESHGGLDAAECLVEITSTSRKSIDVLVRCRKGDEAAAERTLEKVKEIIEAVRDEIAPGIPMGWCYLLSYDLQEHEQNVAVYERSDVENRRREEHIRAEEKRDDSFPTYQVKDLLFPILQKEGEQFPGDRSCIEEEHVLNYPKKAVVTGAFV